MSLAQPTALPASCAKAICPAMSPYEALMTAGVVLSDFVETLHRFVDLAKNVVARQRREKAARSAQIQLHDP